MQEKLRKLLEKSYSPYFNYPVASVVVMKDGKEFYGVNVETSSPSAGICAERNAIYSAFTEGYTKGEIKEINVMSKTEDFCYPCFICRQAISDFCDENVCVNSYTYSGNKNSLKVSDLCSHPFNDNDLQGEK